MSRLRRRRKGAVHRADPARLARAEALREEIERRLARIRQAYGSVEAAVAAYAGPDPREGPAGG